MHPAETHFIVTKFLHLNFFPNTTITMYTNITSTENWSFSRTWLLIQPSETVVFSPASLMYSYCHFQIITPLPLHGRNLFEIHMIQLYPTTQLLAPECRYPLTF